MKLVSSIDHFVSIGLGCNSTSVEYEWDIADHLPIIATYRLRKMKAPKGTAIKSVKVRKDLIAEKSIELRQFVENSCVNWLSDDSDTLN